MHNSLVPLLWTFLSVCLSAGAPSKIAAQEANKEAFSPQGGGYETRLTSYSNLEPGAGRRIAQASLELARKLTPGPVPQLPKASPFRAPWPYGNVPPELD